MLLILHSQIFIVLIIVVSILIIIFLVSKIECNAYKIKTYDIKTTKICHDIKIVYLSDFHDKLYSNDNFCLINDIISQDADFIILGGDFIDFSAFNSKLNIVKMNNTINFINNLSKKFFENCKKNDYIKNRIFFSFGNHELRLRNKLKDETLSLSYKRFLDCLNKNNIRILDDCTEILDNNMTFSGLSLYDGYYTKCISKKLSYKNISGKILKALFKIDNNCFNIIFFHNPYYCEDLLNYYFDLVVCGHNHGGLIKIPIFGAVFSPDFRLFPKYNYGLYCFNDKHCIVTSGIGEHFIKIRVNNKPEICVINIKK